MVEVGAGGSKVFNSSDNDDVRSTAAPLRPLRQDFISSQLAAAAEPRGT